MLSAQYKEHFHRNFLLAYPVMLSQLGHVMVGVADSMMVGRLGAEPLAAASLANSIFFVIFTFGIGVSYAITPMVAVADGQGDIHRSTEVLQNGFLLNLSISILLLSLILTGSDLLYLLNQPSQVVELAIPYFKLIAFSLVPFMFFQTFRQFAEGLSFTRQAMFITLGANLINIGLNYLLIFGKLGFPALGLNGAGWATFISRFIMGILMAGYIYKFKPFQRFLKHIDFGSISWTIIRKLLHIGIPTGLQFVFEVGAFGFAAIMIGWLGAEALAAHQIAINLASISYMMASGISAAATVRVGNQLGRKDQKTLRLAGFTCYLMGILLMSLAATSFIIGNKFLPGLYIDNQGVIEMASLLLIIAAFFQLSDGIQVISLGALRGLSDVKIPTAITLVAYWVLGLPLGYFLSFKFGLGAEGIWYGLLTGLTAAAILLSIRFNYISRRVV